MAAEPAKPRRFSGREERVLLGPESFVVLSKSVIIGTRARGRYDDRAFMKALFDAALPHARVLSKPAAGVDEPAGAQPSGATLGVVIPAYNEALTIAKVVRRVLDEGDVAQVVVVDDASRDGTEDVLTLLTSSRLTILTHSTNRGKGAALRTGFTRVHTSWTLVQDADLEYDPADYRVLLDATRRPGTDVVYGSRYLGRPIDGWHTLVNRALTFFFNLLSGMHLTDMETCYKLLPTGWLRGQRLRCDRFGFEPEVSMMLARDGLRVREVPIRYRRRGYAEGKKITWRDGVRAVAAILFKALTK